MAEQVETLHGLKLTDTQVIITVTSNGCTDKDDFKIELKESHPAIATFIRVQPDFCRAAAHSVDIAFSLKEVGAAEFKVDNPFEPGPGRLDRLNDAPSVTTLAVGEEETSTTRATGGENHVTPLAVGEETSSVTQG